MRKNIFAFVAISILLTSLSLGVQVTLLTIPAQSMVYVNGTLIGQTSLSGSIVLNLDNISNISVQNVGYIPFNFVYNPSSGATVLTVNLQPISYICVATIPSEASVLIDKKDVFLSPATLTTFPGIHELLIQKNGYIPKVISVSTLPFQVTNVNVKLIPFGEVTINSDPPHADVFVNGQYAGKTPLSTVLSMGNNFITLKATNFSMISTSISVSQNSTPQNLLFKMRQMLDVTINSSPLGFVSLDGVNFKTPKSFKLPVGTYTYTASSEYFQSVSGTLSISSSGTYTIFLKPQMSLVVFSSNPSGAAVEVNGKLIGQTQLSKQMPYGTYKVKMIGNNSKVWFGTVKVDQQVVNVYGDMVNAGMITINATPSQNTLVHVGSIWTTLPATLNATVGIYPVEFYNPRFPSKTIYVKINGGSVTDIYEYLQPMGTLFVGSAPAATVTLNGKFIGKTPIFDFKLLPGTYQVGIFWEDGSVFRTLDVQDNAIYNLFFTDPSFVDVKFISFPDPVRIVIDNGNEGYTPFSVKLSRGLHTYKVYDLFGDQISTGIIDTKFMNAKSYFFIGG